MVYKEDLPEKIIGEVKDIVFKKLNKETDKLREKHFPKTLKGKVKKRLRDTFK